MLIPCRLRAILQLVSGRFIPSHANSITTCLMPLMMEVRQSQYYGRQQHILFFSDLEHNRNQMPVGKIPRLQKKKPPHGIR